MPTAILVDAAFFLKRYPHVFAGRDKHDAQRVAKDLHRMCLMHLKQDAGSRKDRRKLYRIFVYDCPPIDKKHHYPISNKAIDFGQEEHAQFRQEFHKALRSQRLVALRLGDLEGTGHWQIHNRRLKEVLSGKRKFEDLTDDDFYFELKQKGVDMKIGIDIASLAYKKLIDQVVLIAGDADFVPAAKLARREGLDFVLDPMWNTIREDLNEHIDGLRSIRIRADNNGNGNTAEDTE